MITINLNINNKKKPTHIEAGETLLETLRRLGYKSVKKGCGEGECGACVVLLNNEPINSCVYLTARAAGQNIMTAEALGTPDNLHPLQKAFLEVGAIQCGYCIPAMLLVAYSLLQKNINPTEEEIKKAIDGNLCRCTGYVKQVDAIKLASKRMRTKGGKK